MKKFYKIICSCLLLICFTMLQSCGQTGDLYLPEDEFRSKLKDDYRV